MLSGIAGIWRMKVLRGEVVFVHMRSKFGRVEKSLDCCVVFSSGGIGDESTWIWRVQIPGGEMVSLDVGGQIIIILKVYFG